MASAAERVKQSFSETRTVVLGAQILLGFQYQAGFQPGFKQLPDWGKAAGPVAFALLLTAIACMIAPTPFHRIAERARATARQCRYLDLMVLVSLVPFALALGLNVVTATSNQLTAAGALIGGVGAAGLALFLWFCVALIRRARRTGSARKEEKSEDMAIKDRINELLEQSRIILPGVQALLGFQLAAYLSDGFKQLPETSKAVHTGALFLLVVAMILLMTLTPYHRLGERGEDSEAFDRVGSRFMLSALPPLALALACDFYVVMQKVTHSIALALGGAALAVAGCFVLWFAVPLVARAKRGDGRTIRR